MDFKDIEQYAKRQRFDVVSVNEEFMDECYGWYVDKLRYVDDINKIPKLWGRKFYTFQQNGTRFMIMPLSAFRQRMTHLNKECPEEIQNPGWCYIMLVCDPAQEDYVRPSMTGSLAFNIFTKMLQNANYDGAEIDEICDAHSEKKDDAETQWHIWSPSKEEGKITKYENCVYYDINKAHASLLMELFPRVSPQVLSLLDQAKQFKAEGKKADAQRIKDIFNMTVGYFNTPKANASETYWWIVHEVTRRMRSFVNNLLGPESELVYVNTDGFVVSNPGRKPAGSDAIGEFGIEYEGPVWVYEEETTKDVSGYWSIQFGNGEIKGQGLPVRMHEHMDLKNGKVVNYHSRNVTDGVTESGKKIQHMEYENVTTIEKEIIDG